MPIYNSVIVEKDSSEPRIARLRLNRPDRLNAISDTTPADIRRAVEWAEAEDEIHVIIVSRATTDFATKRGYNQICSRTLYYWP